MDRAELDVLLSRMRPWRASDLHVKVGSPPSVRIDGDLRLLADVGSVSSAESSEIARQIIPEGLHPVFMRAHEIDFAYSVSGVGRFRVNAYYQRGTVSLAFRLVRTTPASAAELGLPDVIYRLAEERRGMVLVTGPTGCGKTTTLATMIDHINRTRPCHIITIEDPIEYLQADKLARIDQREVGFDTESFASAMRMVLRQDPDVILVGEMRDLETTAAAITAAETGHLVLSTLHTIDATETVTRIVDFFPPHQQSQVRVSLAGALKGTVSQRLVHRADGQGRLPALEVMVTNGRIRRCILEMEHTSEIADIIKEGEYYGMQTFDQCLAELFVARSITLQEALTNATNPHDLQVLLQQRGALATGGAL